MTIGEPGEKKGVVKGVKFEYCEKRGENGKKVEVKRAFSFAFYFKC
jgi:hypothetical protein